MAITCDTPIDSIIKEEDVNPSIKRVIISLYQYDSDQYPITDALTSNLVSLADLFKYTSGADLYKTLVKILQDPNIPTEYKVSQDVLASGYDRDFYESIRQNLVSSVGEDRAKVVANALFMSMLFPHIPYCYGGGHEQGKDISEGVDPSWGTDNDVKSLNKKKYPVYSLDCSSYSSWVFYNSGLKDSFKKLGLTIGTKTFAADYKKGTRFNATIVVDVDKEKNRLLFLM